MGPVVPGSGGTNPGGAGKPAQVAGKSGNETGGTTALGGADTGPNAAGADDGGAGPVAPPDPVAVCGDAPASVGPFTKQALRAAAADCAVWHYCRASAVSDALADDLNAYASAPSDDTLGSARAAYARAFEVWSEVELFQFGPYASSSPSAAKDGEQGEGIRELIYSWPLSARLRVEEQVANQNYLNGWDGIFVSARGLFGLDYLLHYGDTDTVCAPTSVCGKNWAKLDESELALRKQAYAAAIGDDLVTRAATLTSAWAEDGGNFRPLLVDATGYPSEQEAMKIIAWSLLYVEREVKDWKLGVPSGHTAMAPVAVAEAAYSGLGTPAIRANLSGFRGLFEGCGAEGAGLGFDDWLIEAGHPELAQDIVNALRDAQAAADAYPAFGSATPAELEALYQTVKVLTNLLKTDLFGAGSPLGLTLPPGLEGDTD